jgi:hypothetical protein
MLSFFGRVVFFGLGALGVVRPDDLRQQIRAEKKGAGAAAQRNHSARDNYYFLIHGPNRLTRSATHVPMGGRGKSRNHAADATPRGSGRQEDA